MKNLHLIESKIITDKHWALVSWWPGKIVTIDETGRAGFKPQRAKNFQFYNWSEASWNVVMGEWLQRGGKKEGRKYIVI